MKKILVSIMTFVLCLTNVMPVTATENIMDISGIIDASNEISNNLEDTIGLSSTDLLEIMALPAKDETFYGKNAKMENVNSELDAYFAYYESLDTKPYKPSDYGLENFIKNEEQRSRAAYDSNQPLNSDEQSDRMEYIDNIFKTEYYQSKYKGKEGQYYLYLYTSHWTENLTFDPNGVNNFDEIYANIIGENDIIAFNNFYNNTKRGAILHAFENFSSAVVSLNAVGTSSEKVILTLKEFGEKTRIFSTDIVKELEYVGFDKSTIIGVARDISRIYKANYDSVDSALAMIELINLEMDDYGVPGYVTRLFVDLFGLLQTSAVFASIGCPFLVVGVYYFNVLSTIYPMLSLAGLYQNYSTRRTLRYAIYLGFSPRP